MAIERITPALAIACCLAAVATAAVPPDAAPSSVQSIHTRQTDFSIPFRLGPPKSPAQTPVEVLLGVSTDQGRTWNLASRVKPEQGSFAFRAPHDGEYWFSIRTADRQGKFHPDTPPQAELKVVVDTVVPRLDLAAKRGPAGEIIVDWQAVDPNLKSDTLAIEYQTDPNQPWQRLAIDGPGDPTRHTLVGQSTWWPNASATTIVVRAQVVDRAGNPAVNQVQVKADGAQQAGNITAGVASPMTPTNTEAPPGPMDRATNTAARSVSWPADNAAQSQGPRATENNGGNRTSDRDPNWRMAAVTRPGGASSGSNNAGGAVVPTYNASGSESHPGAGDPTLDTSFMPPGEKPRMVNSRTFELEYEVESIGPSGIGKIELWGTRDGGRTWASFGVDADNRSPLVVKVDSEGIYGFRIVVTSPNGSGGDNPRAGDLPDLWIGVDRTKPAVKLTGVEIGKDGSELVLRWEASDELPDPRPISLLFSDRPGGPWTAFASGLENTGSYTWRLDSRAPEQLYLRVEARDEAGNLGIYESPDPLPLDRQRPQGRLRSVRPVE